MKNKIAIVSNEQHHLYALLKESFISFKHVEICFFDIEDAKFSPTNYDLIFDFTVLNSNRKIEFIKKLNVKTISDLTFNNANLIASECANLYAALATALYSPKGCYEVWYKDKNAEQIIDSLLFELKLESIEITDLKQGFIFPRVLCQIINEAYFALEEDLATATDIDAAMKSGVNYPLGPIEWAEKSGLGNIHQYLSELYSLTGQERYAPCSLLNEKGNL